MRLLRRRLTVLPPHLVVRSLTAASPRFRMTKESCGLADDFLFHGHRASAARRALASIAELADIDLQFVDSAAQSVAVHAQFAGSAALVAFVLLQHGQDEALLEFTHAFGI